MDEAIQVFDLRRIFLGDLPWTFVLEIFFRTAFIFVYTLLLVRWMGKRGLGQFTPFEYLLIIAMGSAVGDPMFYPEVPLVHAMAVVTVVVLLQRALVMATERNERLERFVESTPSILVSDGLVDTGRLHKEGLSIHELCETLREHGIDHLGQVKRAYLEPSGQISVFTFSPREVRPGRPVWPANDPDYPDVWHIGQTVKGGIYACEACGYIETVQTGKPLVACPRCGEGKWVEAWGEPLPASTEG